MMRNLRNFGNQISVSLPTDEKGMLSRECPDCKSIFKIKPGTGLKGENLSCYCPYCGWKAEPSDFHTREQIEYAKSVALNQLTHALQRDLKEWGKELERNTRNSLIKLKVDFKGDLRPIRYYQEKQLESYITCEVCSLEYAIYGVFAFCPDCGTHNSIQILNKNMELITKEINFANMVDDKELSEHLIEDALENTVSAFDGFGRATCSAYSSKSIDENEAKNISFQNIQNARKRAYKLFRVDIASVINEKDWELVVHCFQKRHLLAHTMGVIDDEYITKSKDPSAIRGRKISIEQDEIYKLMQLLLKIGNNFSERLKS